MSYFPPYGHSKNKIEVQLDYRTKSDWQNTTGINTSQFTENVELAKLKSEVDKSDIDELKNIPSSIISLKSR